MPRPCPACWGTWGIHIGLHASGGGWRRAQHDHAGPAARTPGHTPPPPAQAFQATPSPSPSPAPLHPRALGRLARRWRPRAPKVGGGSWARRSGNARNPWRRGGGGRGRVGGQTRDGATARLGFDLRAVVPTLRVVARHVDRSSPRRRSARRSELVVLFEEIKSSRPGAESSWSFVFRGV